MTQHDPKTRDMIAVARANLADTLMRIPETRVAIEAEEAAERAGGRLLPPVPQLGLKNYRYEMLGLTGKGATASDAVQDWCLKVEKARKPA